jgi:hypothetical protein
MTPQSRTSDRKDVVKKLLLIAVAVVASAFAAVASGHGTSASATSATQPGHIQAAYGCGTVSHKLTYLFWPKGHVGLPAVYPDIVVPDLPGPPSYPALPHVSVYRVGSKYPDSNWLATVQVLDVPPAVKGSNVAMAGDGRCAFSFNAGARVDQRISHRKTTEKAIALTCRSHAGWFGVGGLDDRSATGWGSDPLKWKVRLADSRYPRRGKVLFEAKTTGEQPRLTYDTSLCKRVRLPR